MNAQVVLFASIVFLSSLVVCLSPRAVTSLGVVKKVFPFLTLATAGFLLGVQLLELSPHMISDCHGHKEHGHNHSHHHSDESPMLGFFVAGLSFIFLLAIDTIVLKHKHCEESENKEHSHSGGCREGDPHRQVEVAGNGRIPEISQKTPSVRTSEKKTERLGCCDPSIIKNTSSKTQVFIYILGISIHSFFEGLAFNSIDKIGSLETGLILHKILESFALGVPLFTSGFNFASGLALAVFYSSLTPIGIMIGSAPGFFNQTVKNIFKGLALGSIMFMVSIEMIPPMFNHPKVSRVHGILTLLIGYLVSAMVIYHSHPH